VSSRIVPVIFWTLLWFFIMFLVVSLTLLGDCPEYINSNWPNAVCSDRKDLLRPIVFIGGPLLWLVVTVLIVRRRRA
jgi:hypothetical protein